MAPVLTPSNDAATERGYRIVVVEGLDGAGKSTLVRSLRDRLPGRVEISRVGRATTEAFRAIADTDDRIYQDVLPPAFRMQAYLFDAVTQFVYLDERYAACDTVLFDRWMHTAELYCAPVDEHEELFAQLQAYIPVPDVVVYLRVDPDLACARLRARDDKWCHIYTEEQLTAKMARLHASYEARFADDPTVVVIDGAAPPERVLAEALATTQGAEARRGAGTT